MKKAASKRKRASDSETVESFLRKLPETRASELGRVRTVMRKNLPTGYDETVRSGMIVYEVPLEQYADTYNGHPLWLAALGAPKSYLTLHLMPVYGDKTALRKLEDGFRTAGKKLDIGKACIHFQTADELALEVIGEIVANMPVDKWVAIARAARTK